MKHDLCTNLISRGQLPYTDVSSSSVSTHCPIVHKLLIRVMSSGPPSAPERLQSDASKPLLSSLLLIFSSACDHFPLSPSFTSAIHTSPFSTLPPFFSLHPPPCIATHLPLYSIHASLPPFPLSVYLSFSLSLSLSPSLSPHAHPLSNVAGIP